MNLLNLFKKRAPHIKGTIAYFSLQDWWLNELTDEDRKIIQATYQPMGGGSLTKGNIGETSQTAVGLLSGMISWFSKSETRSISYKLINKAEDLITEKTKPLDIHFLFNSKIEITYKDRDSSPEGLNLAIKSCEQQISISELSAKELMGKYTNSPLPSHRGYTQLAIILEKKHNYEAAIEIVKQAKSQGWAGDWDKRIKRCTKKSLKLIPA